MIIYYKMQENTKKNLKFIHITKCAGTFIEEIGREKNIKWGMVK